MNQTLYQTMLAEIRAKPRTLDRLQDDYAGLWSPLGWSADQVRLFIRCCADLDLDEQNPETPLVRARAETKEEALSKAIYTVIEQHGRPIAASQIKTRLPPEFVTSSEQIIAEIKRHPSLEIVGPGLARIKQ
jgi:hypothetical protein